MKRLICFIFLVPLLFVSTATAQDAWNRWPGYSITIPGLAANGSNITTTVPVLVPDGTNAAPAVAASTDPTDGLTFGGNAVNVIVNGAIRETFGINFVSIAGTEPFVQFGTNTRLFSSAANTLYQKGVTPTNPQAFWLANTDDGAGNYERLENKWEANAYRLNVGYGGTGQAREIYFSWNGTAAYALASTTFYPSPNDSRLFGISSNQWAAAYISRSIQGSKTTTLSDNVKKAFVEIPVPQAAMIGGDFTYVIKCEDAADRVLTSGRVAFVTQGGDAGLETCVLGAHSGVATTTDNTKTLTNTFTCNNSPTNGIQLEVQSDCSIVTPTAMSINWRLDLPTTATVTPLP